MGGLALLFYLAQNSTIINLVKVAVPRGGAYMSGILTMGGDFVSSRPMILVAYSKM